MRARLSVKTALFGLVGMAALVMFGLLGLMLYSSEQETMAAESLHQTEQQASLVSDSGRLFLQLRRTEKDFLLRLDDKYVVRHATLTAQLNESVLALISRAESEDRVTLQALVADIGRYEQAFAALVASHRQLGYNENEGLQGTLRSAVHEVETVLNEIGRPEMQVKMLMMRRHEKDFIMRLAPKYLDRLNARVEEFLAFPGSYYTDAGQRTQVETLLVQYQTAFAAYVDESLKERELRKALSAEYAVAEPRINALIDTFRQRSADLALQSRIVLEDMRRLSLTFGLAAMVVFVIGAVMLTRGISRPLVAIRGALDKLRAGDLDWRLAPSRISETQSIGAVTEQFRLEQVAERALEARLAEVIGACAQGDFSKRVTVDDNASGASLAEGVNAIGEAAEKGLQDVLLVLKGLSEGDLSVGMSDGQKGLFQEISDNIDELTARMRASISQMALSSNTLSETSDKITETAKEASKRGQSSAASLEESAAAISTLVGQVHSLEKTALGAEESLDNTRNQADNTRSVAEDALDAMKRIEQSSNAIGQIIGMIEDVAFQTNLLALNAGVEAARAGSAGRGFAIVAQEVRSLAQKASNAASEITDLVRRSNEDVADGVRLVTESSTSLTVIQQDMQQFVALVTGIATTSREQSQSVGEINTAIRVIDSDVQKSAEALDEMTEISHQLNTEAGALSETLTHFKLPDATRPEALIAAE
ncbi:methyl-accepting chemotaxis protein [Pacificoceanicola onchidii]|uniref:methyl-accepting chemotaxis protein n=1 Tax=Pacificoceanicola onchidii TaxID=2562685 RepID=UPI0014561DC7|nr:methyl-accepting chemotaxis protein [Pacificoceanicola onchidii]